MYKFELDEKETAKLQVWLKEQRAKRMREHPHPMDFKEYPYEGAIGGGITYSFTPTSIGTIVTVTYNGETIDLTEYESW